MTALRCDRTKFTLPVANCRHAWRVVLLAATLLCTGTASAQGLLPDISASGEVTEKLSDPLSIDSINSRTETASSERAAIAPTSNDPSAILAGQKLERIKHLLSLQKGIAEELVAQTAGEGDKTSTEPSSPSLLNSLYETLDSAHGNLEAKLANLAASEEALELSKKELGQLKSTGNEEPGNSEPKEFIPLMLARLDVRISQEEAHLAALEVRQSRAASGGIEQLAASIEQHRLVLAQTAIGSSDAQDKIAVRVGKLAQQEKSAASNLEIIQLRIDAAQKRLALESTAVALSDLKILTSMRDLIRANVALFSTEQERLNDQKTVWVKWAQVLGGTASRQDLHAWSKYAKQRLKSMQLDEVLAQTRVSDIQNRIDALEEKLLEGDIGANAGRLYAETKDLLLDYQENQLTARRGIQYDQRLTRRLLNDVEDKVGNFNLFEWGSKALDSVLSLWNYEITTVDEAPFTLGSLTIGLTLFGTGLVISRRASALVGRFVANKTKLDAGASQAVQALSFYAMLIGICLLALKTVHFPLTAFAFLGGALAIGVGFGSQNVMNNFISGLILMLERPVRALDVVEVDGNYGTIEGIGARSTTIRSTDGRHIVVPNSFFLENNVINWTLSDELFRTKVSVGVAYGSPTQLVSELMGQVVEAHKQVLQQPAPIVIFDSFGDSALVFDVHFWVTARSPMGVKQIESTIRHAIDKIFRENELVIAFPQSDVHLDTLSPIEISMVQPAPEKQS